MGYISLIVVAIFVNIENLTSSNFDDTLIGDANDNVFRGRTGNDTIEGEDVIDIAAFNGLCHVN